MKNKINYNRFAMLVAFVMVIQVAFIGCEKTVNVDALPAKKDDKLQASKTIKVVAVKELSSSGNISLPVSFEGFEKTTLVPRIEGYVKTVNVDIGDQVKKGDVLIELDAPELEAEKNRREKMLLQAEKGFETAIAKLNQAKSHRDEQQALLALRETELNRVGKLVDKGSLSADRRDEAEFGVASAKASMARVEADIVAAEADAESAKAAIDVAKAELSKATAIADFRKLSAPFDGVITMRDVDAGAYVVPSANMDDALLKIERVSKLRGIMHIGVGGIGKDTKARLHNISGLPDVTVEKDADGKPVTIARTSNVFDPKTRLMRLELELKPPVDPETKSPLLKPGDYATATLLTEDEKSRITVPASAVGEEKDGKQFVVVLKDRTCHRVYVTTGQTSNGNIVVQPGDGLLKLKGMNVIAESPSDYRNGQEIEEDVKIKQ